ncbi:unnamed protein product (macronuclear) [Paramecium tetraurelia]|uniref:Bromo domain-containing protein n=1 Tax=Paramecium tetraurelia TaxID=5888 RepID=A0EBZ7_PARTE|nr:uncharacterized protein GSPATT00025550001 [Paramecium tetraurelia]CAK92814.1 unnamed protein product [Paramecium tetraurelia]|eukprot:XP_001460211.1 hypothetical protein (macronuclear) [Paramecium tetraurelia strain d4-2]
MDSILHQALMRFDIAANDGKVNAEQVISILQSLNYNPQDITKIVSQITADIDVNQFKELLTQKEEPKQDRLSTSQIRQIEDEFRQAVKYGNVDKVLQYLNKYQNQIDLANKMEPQNRQIPTYDAVQAPAEYQAYLILKTLYEHGSDIHYRDAMQQSIMFYICRDGRCQLFDFLISKGLSVNEQDQNGQTPIFYAARENKVEILQRLIQNGANVNHRDKILDQTALFYSAKEGQFQACQLLIDAGCKISHQDATKKTAVAYAKKFNRKEVYDLLILGAQRQKDETNQKRDDGHSKIEQKINRKKNKDLPKFQYKIMHIDEKGLSKEVTNEDFEKFSQEFPEIAKLLINPDDTIDEAMISSIKEDQMWDKIAKKILNQLWKLKQSVYFLEPVDVNRYQILDYYDIVRNPMDFGTIKSKLSNNQYRCLKEFHIDMLLVFDNCVLYNGIHSEVGQAGIKVKQDYLLMLEQNGINKNL